MGAPESGMDPADRPTAEALLTAFRTIKDPERSKHESVLDYWLSIRGDKEFPPLHDLDPLEISDAGPTSVLLELIGGGQDAAVRHLGEALSQDAGVDRIIDAPNPSILHCIAKKLPIVAISRDFLAFEDSFGSGVGSTRCWVTLLPLSSCGSWVDYVYAFVSVETVGEKAKKFAESSPEEAAPVDEPVTDEVETLTEETEPVIDEVEPATEEVGAVADEVEPVTEEVEPVVEEAEAVAEEVEPVVELPASEPETAEEIVPESTDELVEVPEAAAGPDEVMEPIEASSEPEPEQAVEAPAAKSGPGFSKLLEGFANLTGFYGQGVNVDAVVTNQESADADPTSGEPETVDPPEVEAEAPAPEREPLELEAEASHEPEDKPVMDVEPEPEPLVLEQEAAEEPAAEPIIEDVPEPASAMEGSLQNQLDQVRAKADEARQAQLRATAALHEGLSAAYDFALDAETSPEEYLRLVEAQGLKIQLRAPMAPVAKLAFHDVCEAATIKQFEAVLAWALKEELPRGTLLERIDQAGGVSELLAEISPRS